MPGALVLPKSGGDGRLLVTESQPLALPIPCHTPHVPEIPVSTLSLPGSTFLLAVPGSDWSKTETGKGKKAL
jgi:hypothetical protein